MRQLRLVGSSGDLRAPRASQYESVFKWAGSKAALTNQICPHLRPLLDKGRYIEPFVGSAALFLNLSPKASILGDSNVYLMQAYSAIKRAPEAVYNAMETLVEPVIDANGDAFVKFYYQIRERFPSRDMYERCAEFIFLNRHCWNGLYRENIRGKFNTPIGSARALRPLPSLDALRQISTRLKAASLQQGDFRETLRFAAPGDLVYCDPPYVPTSGTSRFTEYQSDVFDWDQQLALRTELFRLTDCNVLFFLTNSNCARSKMLYKEFDVSVLRVNRPINSDALKRTGHTEILVTNMNLLSEKMP